jgi:hypothetical protein
MPRRSWTEKFACDKRPEVKPCPKDFADIKRGQTMLLTTPRDVAAAIRKIPRGQEVDIKTLRAALARTFQAETACPVVTGIHLRTVAERVGEQLEAGARPQDVVPVWRAMPDGAPIWKRIENGRAELKAQRQAEGLRV